MGGTKTAIATFDPSGNKIYQTKIKTDHNYEVFIKNLTNLINRDCKDKIKIACMGIPGLINRKEGLVHALGNLPWQDKKITEDLKAGLDQDFDILIENDTRLAGLGEARALPEETKHKRVLYMTISTGIGGALIVDGNISKDLEDTEMGKMPLYYKDGELRHWEDFASGRAFYNEHHQRAGDVTNEEMWNELGLKVAYGLGAVCSTLQPEVIVFGGGVGQFADRFTTVISKYLEENLHAIVRKPGVCCGPAYGEDSVLFGCREYIKDYVK